MQVSKPGEKQDHEPVEAQADTLFLQAQDEYLMGHWEETQLLLRRRLELEPRDVEARLLLATSLRHQRKMEQASRELAKIERFDQAVNWDYEIARERELIQMILDDDQDNGSHDDASEEDLSERFNDGFVRQKVVHLGELNEQVEQVEQIDHSETTDLQTSDLSDLSESEQSELGAAESIRTRLTTHDGDEFVLSSTNHKADD